MCESREALCSIHCKYTDDLQRRDYHVHEDGIIYQLDRFMAVIIIYVFTCYNANLEMRDAS
jgi:hypothetical protein